MPEYGRRKGGKEPSPTKRVAPRDVDDQRNKPLSDEERARYLERRAREAALYRNPDPQSGFELSVRVLSATIQGNDIYATVVFEGGVVRPEADARAKGHSINVMIPAELVRDERVTD